MRILVFLINSYFFCKKNGIFKFNRLLFVLVVSLLLEFLQDALSFLFFAAASGRRFLIIFLCPDLFQHTTLLSLLGKLLDHPHSLIWVVDPYMHVYWSSSAHFTPFSSNFRLNCQIFHLYLHRRRLD